MKYFVLSDNTDTLTGLRLVGIKGVAARSRGEAEEALKKALDDPETGVLLITDKLADQLKEEVQTIKNTRRLPILVEIPTRGGNMKNTIELLNFAKESVGIKI
jgi:ATP synthase (F/14-kDa) subunit.